MTKSTKQNKNVIRRNGRNRRVDTLIRQDHAPPIVRYTPSVFGFPKRLEVKLRYAAYEGLFLSSVAGSLAKNFFSVNSTFDPDRTTTGHQPLYRDTYASIYNQYAVIKSRIIVDIINTNATAYWTAGVTIEDDNAGTSVVDTAGEQSTSLSHFIGPLSSSNSAMTIIRDWDCVRDLNIDPYTSETYKTANTSNPNEEQFFMIWGNDTGSGTSNLVYRATIEYTVLWTELTTPTQS